MSAKLRALQARKAEQVSAARKFNDETDAKAAAENRAWTEEENKQFAALNAATAATSAAIDREQALIAEEAGLPPAVPGASSVTLPAAGKITVAENADKDPKRGFRSFGDFATSVRGARIAQRTGAPMDARLVPLSPEAAAPGTYGNEASGSDGGFLIPADFSSEIFTLSLGEGALLPFTDNVTVSGNGMVFPKDETTPWGTNGIRAYWQAEAGAGTATKPVLGAAELRLKKLMALVPVSDELLADTNALQGYLPKKVALSIQWKTNEAILWGAGAGLPQGALQSNAVITVAKETGQATLTLQPQNLAKMIARLPEGSYGRAFWIVNNDVLPALFTMTLGNYPIYLPGGASIGGMQMNPYGSLLGRPIIVSQHAKSFSSQGDVVLVDLSYYQAITKAEGVQTATSMHLYFDADAMAFRTTFRMDGQSKIVNSITPANGSNNLSPYVQLGAR